MTGARIDDNERALLGRNVRAFGRDDADQRVVHRAVERAAVDQHLSLVMQHIRSHGRVMLPRDIAALTQHVEEKDGALDRVDPVVRDGAKAAPAKQGTWVQGLVCHMRRPVWASETWR